MSEADGRAATPTSQITSAIRDQFRPEEGAGDEDATGRISGPSVSPGGLPTRGPASAVTDDPVDDGPGQGIATGRCTKRMPWIRTMTLATRTRRGEERRRSRIVIQTIVAEAVRRVVALKRRRTKSSAHTLMSHAPSRTL